MTCVRCLGLMVIDHFLDFDGPYGHMWTASWRCMNCGHVHDAVIEQHRLAQQEQAVALPRGVPDYQDDEVNLGTASIIRPAA